MKINKMMPMTRAVIKTALDNDKEMTNEERRLFDRALGSPCIKRELVTTKKACEILDACEKTLNRYAQKGFLTPVRYSKRKIRWDKEELEAFRDAGMAGAVAA
jgi:hypothetical protein